MPAFATVEDLKKHLNKQTNADDEELQDVLDAASERVRSLIGTSFDAVSVTERVTVLGDGTVVLSHRPVSGGVVLNGGAITGHTVSADAGVLYGVRPGWSSYPVMASYSAGGGPVPASVMLATLIIAAHLWETQRGTTLSPLSQQDADLSGQPFGGGAGFAIPNRARELLEPFIHQPQAS